ncbi:MAG: mechanosensitive ion channel family protein [Calditrichaeota bacterium]|nr:MAG: mechanosensitive ion channel family protein [Calditrichota bacterium]
MEQYVGILKEFAVQYGLKIVGAILILIIGRIIISLLIRFLKKLMKKTNVDPTVSSFLTTFTRIALLAFVILAALSTVGVETTSIIAVLGAAGLAVGFALQGSLSNFASGIMLVTFRPIKAGDLVEVSGFIGRVKEVLIFNTFITTLENKLVIIPNSKVTSDAIVNYSAEGHLRCDMEFGVSYGDDIDKAKKILVEIMASDSRVLKDPAFTVAVKTLNNSSVDFVVRPYVTVDDYWPVYFDTTEKVKKAFDAQGVTIPFPQRDVHMFQATGS